MKKNLKKSPCTPTSKEERREKIDSLKKQDAPRFPFTPNKITKQKGGKLSNSKSNKKASIPNQRNTLALPNGKKTKLKIESIEKCTKGGNSTIRMKQELVTKFMKKSSANDKNICRGSLLIQSFGTKDGPERAVEGPSNWHNTIQPIRATNERTTTSKMGQANQEDRNGDCASNWMTGRGQVTEKQEFVRIGQWSPGQKLHLGGEA